MITLKWIGQNRALLGLLSLGLSLLGGDCDGDIVQDPTFRDWCGDSLCAWTLEAGKVLRVPTWNVDDLGVSFASTPTRISQATTESSAACILFTSVANVDPAADMTLSVDFNSDGSFESTTPISGSWQNIQTEITAPAAYQGITFVLAKAGSGTAVLAEMRVQSTTGCTAPAVATRSLGFGEKCSTSADCAEGLMCTGTTGDLLCSQCSDSSQCAAGVSCSTRSVFFPSQCGPGEKLGASGALCITDSDCASGACDGATPIALGADAGTCDLDGELGSSDPANCQWFGVRGGQCR
jgi:hypothetical protein